jgi:uracil-DNA glycosylase
MNDAFSAQWEKVENRIVTCRKCERLVSWREHIAMTRKKAFRDWEYWGKPVPGFGDNRAKVWAVGLAPGAHGSNRTGRSFTGDGSGNFLFRVLYHTGFANQPDSTRSGDGLTLKDLFISAVCRCAPPQNKPQPDELINCRVFLEEEFALLQNVRVIVALGKIAFDQTLGLLSRSLGIRYQFPFIHGNCYDIPETPLHLVSSYHPSRQNTQTGRLTEPMFENIWVSARKFLD